MKIENKEYLNYSDVLIKPKPSFIDSRSQVQLNRFFEGQASGAKIYANSVMITNMDTVGTIKMAMAVQDSLTTVCLHKFHTADEIIAAVKAGLHTRHFISIGMGQDDIDKVKKIHQETQANMPILIDVANGYISKFTDHVAEVRKAFPDTFIAAGNIATTEVLHWYADAGVDAVRVGIGPGGQCRTRETTGVGIPQLTAVMDVVDYADQYKLLVIADGGINEYADFAKALGAGADWVCAGSMFAGSNEAAGDLVYKNGTHYKHCYGMSSEKAMELHYGEIKDYRASEGRVSNVPMTGDVMSTVNNILGSLRSSMTYVGVSNITKFEEAVTFIKVNDTINRKYEHLTVGI